MEDIEIRMDASEAEEGIQIITLDLKELQKQAKEIGAGISNSFAPIVNSLLACRTLSTTTVCWTK